MVHGWCEVWKIFVQVKVLALLEGLSFGIKVLFLDIFIRLRFEQKQVNYIVGALFGPFWLHKDQEIPDFGRCW